MTIDSDKILREAWDEISGAYQDRYAIGTGKIHYGPLCPSESKLELLGPLKGKSLLELGSGAGQNAIVASQQGANVTAIDISKKQIEHGVILAKKAKVEVNFIVGSFRDFSELKYKDKFDVVLSVYALQYCTNQKELDQTIKSVYDSLKVGGKFVFSLDHPIRAHGHWDQSQFIIDHYFDRREKKWSYNFPEQNLSPLLVGSYKTISDYFLSLMRANFTVTKLLEPEPMKRDDNSNFGKNSQYGINAETDPYNYSNLKRVPGTIIFQALKK